MKYYLDTLKSVVGEHAVIQHRFFSAFRNGEITKEQVVRWLEQQFYFSISLPSAFAAIYARTPDKFWQVKRSLVPLLDLEAWGSEDNDAHSNAFKKVTDFLQIDIQKLTEQEPKQYTNDYVSFRFNICFDSHRSIGEGLTAIALGNEVLNLYLYKAYREGIHKISGLENCPTDYFDAHLDDEEADFKIFAELFENLNLDSEEKERAKIALIELLDHRVTFLDHLSQDIGLS
jgi:pyrroloquinoline quinone (PQQ) biosynthesis protein C